MTTKSYSSLSTIVDTKTDELSGTLDFGAINDTTIGLTSPTSGSFTYVERNGSPVITQDDVTENLIINGNFRINQRDWLYGNLDNGDTGLDMWTASATGCNIQSHPEGGIILNGRISQYVSIGSINGHYTLDVESPSGSLMTYIEELSGATLPFTVNVTDRQWIKITLEGVDAHIKQVMFGKGDQNVIWNHPTNIEQLRMAKRYFMKGATPKGTVTDNTGVLAHVFTNWYASSEISFPEYMAKAPSVVVSGISLYWHQDTGRTYNGSDPYNVTDNVTETGFTTSFPFSGGGAYGSITGWAQFDWEADATQTTVVTYAGFTTNAEGQIVLEL